jgi:hypothetical protein
VLPREAALAAARHWQRRIGLLREPGAKRASLDSLRAVYLPVYLYGALAESSYRASVGEYYYVKENNKRVRRTEFYPLQGEHTVYVRDVVVTASRGIPNDELEHIEPFDLRALHRYSAALISGWPAEEPSVTQDECLALARSEALARIGLELPRFMPGDTHRELQHRTLLQQECLELVLVPLWVFALRYDPERPPIRLIINGQTGRAYGKVPWSVVRVTILIVLAVLMVAALAAIAYYAAHDMRLV